MNATLRRIEELERTQEWHEAFAEVERVIAWAVATGRCTTAEGDSYLTQMKRAVPLSLFVAGKWRSSIFGPDHEADTTAMMDAFHAWEQAEGIAS